MAAVASLSRTVPAVAPASTARPFLKWAGGKTQLLPQLLARFPSRFERYHEPFLGGGAVFFALGVRRAVLSDINADLIAAYAAIRDDVEGVIAALARHRPSERHFYRVRAQASTRLSAARRAARTIFLNRTCFNGLYRVNRRGEFNVPWGHYARPRVCHEERLRAVAVALRRARLQCASAFAPGARIRRGDLVYFDPPYDPASATARFTAYAAPPFCRGEQERLAARFAQLARRGVHVVLSNADTPFVRHLYRDFRIERVMARRAINSAGHRRGAVGEVIVSGY